MTQDRHNVHVQRYKIKRIDKSEVRKTILSTRDEEVNAKVLHSSLFIFFRLCDRFQSLFFDLSQIGASVATKKDEKQGKIWWRRKYRVTLQCQKEKQVS